jgi:serine/threonine protein kinase
LTRSHESTHDGANTPLAIDTLLQGRYRIVRQLGRGGMGAVYEAVDQRLGITVALKETLSSEASMRKQFEHEARLLAGMQHPALPRVSDHFVEGYRAFLVMQFIGGVDLARIISQQPGPFPREQVIAWADQLLDALIYLHSRDRQVIHRDIKPHNLKLTATGQIALLDFGLAKAQPSDPSITSSQAFFGYTRHYAPLEQIQDRRTDARSDIYALGATLYHLLTGTKPPDAMVRATALLNSEPDPLLSANKIHEAVGPQIAAILDKAMAQKPEDRFADANEFREALRRMGRTKEVTVDVRSIGRVNLANNALARNIAPTVHVDNITSAPAVELPVLQMSLVASARRFGPAGLTAVIAVLLTLGFGALYASQHWAEASSGITSDPPSYAAVVQRQPGVARKVERSRSAETGSVLVAKLKNASYVSSPARPSEKGPSEKRANEKRAADIIANSHARASREPAVSNMAPRKSAGPVANSHTSAGPTVSNITPRKSPRSVGAPSIRLPNPEFRNSVPESSPDVPVRNFGSSSSAPKFFRAADGTQIVKFSDGTTRYVRPGERSAKSDGSYR